MNAIVSAELADDLTIDITTTGVRSRRPRRIEIWMLDVGGRYFITGTPGPRDWLANLMADPSLTVHLKRVAHTDLAATARPVTDRATRRDVLTHPSAQWYREQATLEHLLAEAPLVEVTLVELTPLDDENA
ncbi:nitroreductase/quinone reductase family protein [Desertimonas flava]|uniref:nitroreductase/quinone reductase family protein n=1 Tax=Desertimonas flava TaxID=2064846 RepID=UPI000E34A7EC|nr:nitroreductase/quinone reductase family protein [Desertimonas flava]